MDIATICASLMYSAYSPMTLATIRELGMTWLDVIENGASYAVLTGDGSRVFVVFRGSNDSQDFLWDLRFIKTDFPGGGRVHRGFHAAFMAVWPALERKLSGINPELPRIVTGHSLGGAMAQQAAASMELQEAHVFGCPRVGNADFAKRITCPGTRWEARFDLVTGMPFRFGPVQAVSALLLGRRPTSFTQPQMWPSLPVASTGHSSKGYREAMFRI